MEKELTDRQKEVCQSFIKSKGIDIINFISNDLCIGPTTTRTHISDIYHKLLVNSHAELMYYLMEKILNARNDNKRTSKKIQKKY